MTTDSDRDASPTRDGGAWIGVGASIVLVGALLAALWSVLNPFVLLLALAAAMLPLRRSAFFWPVLGSAMGLTGFWLLSELGFLLAPFVLGLVAAYVLNPAVDWLSRRPWLARLDGGEPGPNGRSVAIGVLVLPLVALVTGLLVWGIPALAREANALAQRIPELLDEAAGLLASLERRLSTLPGFEESEWLARLQAIDGDDLVELVRTRGESLAERAWQGVLGLGRGLGTIFSVLGYLVLTPVVAFYLMRDYRKLGDGMMSLIPEGRTGIRTFLADYDRLLAAYLRGQLTVALAVGAITAVGLWIAQFPYAFLLGSMVAVFGLVPYLGLVLSLLPAIAIALTSGSIGVSLLTVAIVYGGAQTLEGTVLSPRILGDSTGLHPVWILLAIALGGFFFGFVGLLIAVPAAVGMKLVAVRAVERYRASATFTAPGEPAATGDA